MVKKTQRRRKSAKPQLVDAEFEKRLIRKNKSLAKDAAAEPVTEMSAQELKAERLAGALRENLRKRKDQSRARKGDHNGGSKKS